jgi:hypothetical protein
MHKKIRPDSVNQFAGRAWHKQVHLVPNYAGERCRRFSSGDGMDVIALGQENGQAMTANKSTGARDQNLAHSL